MKLHVSLACALLVSLASCAPQFLVAAQYGPQTPSGDIGLTTGGGANNRQNSLDDLGLDESADTFGVVGDFKWGVPHLTVGLQQSSWDGSGTLGDDFGGINQGVKVNSDADLGLYRAACTFDLLPTDVVELGIGFGASVVDMNLDVEGGGVSESIDQTIPIPLLAIRGGARVWRIDLQALLAGIDGSFDGNDVQYFEGDLSGRFAIFGRPGEINGSIVLGWHYIDLSAKFDDGSDEVDADLTFDGPYVGLQIGI